MEPPISASSESCVFPMDQGVLVVVMQTENFPSPSSCRLEGEQRQLAHVFSQPFPFSFSLCITIFRISLWLPAKAIPIFDQEYWDLPYSHQIGWAALTFPRTSEGTGSDCCAVLLSDPVLRLKISCLGPPVRVTWMRSFQVAEELKWEAQCTSCTSFPPAQSNTWTLKADQSESGLHRDNSWSWEIKHYLVKHWKHFWCLVIFLSVAQKYHKGVSGGCGCSKKSKGRGEVWKTLWQAFQRMSVLPVRFGLVSPLYLCLSPLPHKLFQLLMATLFM